MDKLNFFKQKKQCYASKITNRYFPLKTGNLILFIIEDWKKVKTGLLAQ